MDYTDHYGTVADATDYFANRLHEFAWTRAKPTDRPKALIAATRIIDTLNWKGNKSSIQTLMDTNGCTQCYAQQAIDAGCVTQHGVQEASLSQNLAFPRGHDTAPPQDVICACYEISHSLLDGKDPEIELENLGVLSQGYASVRVAYSRSHVPIEHIINYVPNALAWRWLKPFLYDEDRIILTRVS